MSLPDRESQTRIRVPLADVVASNRPEGGTASVVSAVVCAAIMDMGCCCVAGGGFLGGAEGGGPRGSGATQGGK